MPELRKPSQFVPMKAPERTYPGRSVGIPLRMVQASQRHLRPIRYRLCSSQFAICRASDAIFSLRPASMALPLPTRRLVKRLVEEIPAFDRYTARYGHDAALRRFRSVEGHRLTHEPLERAEIDHTNLDLFVIDDETLLPLGRPWFSACEDDYTRCILGMLVGFIPPSFLTVSLCLKDAFRPKTWLKQAYPDIRRTGPLMESCGNSCWITVPSFIATAWNRYACLTASRCITPRAKLLGLRERSNVSLGP